MRNRYQRRAGRFNAPKLSRKDKFKVVAGRELGVRLPPPLEEVREELQAEVGRLAGDAGVQILCAILEDGVGQRVGPRNQPYPAAGDRRWGRQQGTGCLAGRREGP